MSARSTKPALPKTTASDGEHAPESQAASFGASQDADAFPYKQLGVLAICRLAEPVAFCSIIAYSFVMVQDLKGDEDASFYAGLLVSAFALAEACTAMIWGHLSDRYGRKPIIMVALAGTALSSLLFGFAKNYWLALLARVVGGLLNGNVAVMQTMVAEMVKKPEHEPRAYALQPFMWSLGSIAGAALGGFTAQPAHYHPSLFSEDGIFGRFPYLLPNLVSVVVIIIAMIQGFLFLEETNPILVSRRQRTTQETHSRTIDETTPLRSGHLGDSQTTKRRLHRPSDASYVTASLSAPNEPSSDLRRLSFSTVSSFKPLIGNITVGNANAVQDEDDEQQPDERPVKAFNSSVVLYIVAIVIMSFHQMAYASLLPVYLLDEPRKPSHHLDLVGGLGQDLPSVGTYLAINSIISLLIQAIIFSTFVTRVGVWRSALLLTVFCPFVYLVIPLVSTLPNPSIGVYIVMTFQSFSTIIIYPCLLILLKNATAGPTVLGKVNGLAMSLCSGARTIAPPLVGIIYSAFGSAGGWWSCAIFAIVAAVEFFFVARPEVRSEESSRRSSDAIEDA